MDVTEEGSKRFPRRFRSVDLRIELGMKITIFGGGGFIGSAIADRLLADHHMIRVFERPRVQPYRSFSGGEYVEWVTGDLQSTHDLATAVDGSEVIVHLVSTTLPKSSSEDPIYDVQTNLVSTLQLLNIMVEKSIERIIFISSGGTVYGTPIYIPIDENHPTDPHVSYGITKLAIEKYLLMYARMYGIKPVILRVSNPFGERQRLETAQGAVGIFVSRALQGLPLEIWGDGSVIRDFLYVRDVAAAFAKAVCYSGAQRVFNISSGKGTSLKELVGIVEDVLEVPVRCVFKPGRNFDIPVNILSNELAKRELHWVPQVSLKEGIDVTAQWMREELAV